MANLWLEVRVQLLTHPKLTASANSLGLRRCYLLGHLVSLWLGALEYAEDGDLWRGDDEASFRFIEALSDFPPDPENFLSVLRLDHWLEGWLIHDWLDYAGKYLITRYKSHNRDRLVQMWKKHGKKYGSDGEANGPPDTSQGKLPGTNWEAAGTEANIPNNNPNLKPITLNPQAQNEMKKESPKGGLGEISADMALEMGFSNVFEMGYRVQGYPVAQAELTCDGISCKEVYEAFRPLLTFHGVITLEAFYHRTKHCQTTPAQWIMLFLDKLHAVYRDRSGVTLLDTDADPVAMTMSGLIPTRGRHQHQPTKAARQLFVEIMIDVARSKKGEQARWPTRMSGPAITLELARRKGKTGKVA